MALTLYGRVGLLALAAILTGPRVATSAPIRIQVQASSDAGSFEDSSSGNGPVKSGTALADRDSGFTDIDNGPLALCAAFPGCDFAPADPWGLARAEANGTTGSLKVRAIASPSSSPDAGSAFAWAQAELSDLIDFLSGPPVIDLYLDLTQFSGDSEIRFSLSKQTSPDTFINYFLLDAADDWYEIYVNGELVDEGSSLPSALNYSIENPALSFFGFDAYLSAYASDEGQVIADNSVYLGVKGPYISANGFSYPGFATDPTPTPVPEPGTALLLLSGLGALGARQRRRRREH